MDPETRLRDHLGVVLVGHGSRQRGFAAAMKKVGSALAKNGFYQVVCAYLEITRPSIPEAIDRLARKRVKQIRVLPYFVMSGRHVISHIPEIVRQAAKKHPEVKIRVCPYLGYHEKITQVARQRLKEAQ